MERLDKLRHLLYKRVIMRKATLLFVYGTMLSTGCNRGRLRGAQFVGEFDTLDRFVMHTRQSVWTQTVPVVVRDRAGHPVRGELYALPFLMVADEIDPLEGHPTFYRRERVRLRGCSGLRVETYVYQQPLGDALKVLPVGGVLAFQA